MNNFEEIINIFIDLYVEHNYCYIYYPLFRYIYLNYLRFFLICFFLNIPHILLYQDYNN